MSWTKNLTLSNPMSYGLQQYDADLYS